MWHLRILVILTSLIIVGLLLNCAYSYAQPEDYLFREGSCYGHHIDKKAVKARMLKYEVELDINQTE